MTLVFVLFVPIFLGVMLGSLAIYGLSRGWPPAYYLTGFLLLVGPLYYLLVMRLRRVEMGASEVYMTDFFRHARYDWLRVAQVREQRMPLLTIVHIDFAEPGRFGSPVRFLASQSRWRIFKEEHPDLAARIIV